MSTYSAFRDAVRRTGKPMDMRTLGRDVTWRREMAARNRAEAELFTPAATAVDSCPICGSPARAHLADVYGFSYVSCTACGHVYLVNPPDAKDLEALYQPDESSLLHQIYTSGDAFERRVAQISRPKAEFCLEHIPGPGCWLDVGCHAGELIYALRALGWEVRGYEAEPAAVAHARELGLHVERRFVSELDRADLEGIDVVSLLNVLEHVRDPKSTLRGITRHMRAGTHLVVELPRHPSLSSFANTVHPDLVARHLIPPQHLHIFSEQSFESILLAAGYEPKAIWVFGQDYQELVYTSIAHAGVGAEGLVDAVLGATNRVQLALDEAGLSDAMLVVAEKREAPPA